MFFDILLLPLEGKRSYIIPHKEYVYADLVKDLSNLFLDVEFLKTMNLWVFANETVYEKKALLNRVPIKKIVVKKQITRNNKNIDALTYSDFSYDYIRILLLLLKDTSYGSNSALGAKRFIKKMLLCIESVETKNTDSANSSNEKVAA